MFSLEQLKDAYLLRGHDKGDFGDEWTWGCVLIKRGSWAFLEGLDKIEVSNVHRNRKSLFAYLASQGFTQVSWIRKRLSKWQLMSFRL